MLLLCLPVLYLPLPRLCRTLRNTKAGFQTSGFVVFFTTPKVPVTFSNPQTIIATHELATKQAQGNLLVIARSFGQVRRRGMACGVARSVCVTLCGS